jgi:uncharacterized membrane protein
MIVAVVRNRSEFVGVTNGLVIGIIIVAAGVLFYFLSRMWQRKKAT